MQRDWDEDYAAGDMPWDSGRPATALVELVEAGRLPQGRALDVGCGTGTNVGYLASRGYEVVGLDVSELAIERARKSIGAEAKVALHHLDFLAEDVPVSPFDLVFDRGCFHVFDDPADQQGFAERVARCLAPDGMWLSLLGSTEGPPRETGPPRRSARDIVNAVEPALEIVELRAIELDTDTPTPVPAWLLLAGHREVPAQPSTVWE